MAMPVLATKFFVPPPRPVAEARLRLTEKLDAGLHGGRKLSLICAPAGFGKTTALGDWVAARRLSDPELRVAWLSLEPSDNDPARFRTYLESAVDIAYGRDGSADDDPMRSLDAAITALVNATAHGTDRLLLVLDDFQVIEDHRVCDAMILLINHLPRSMHLAIASRSDPLLPIARLRARGELTEVRAADLRFTAAEAGTFLTTVSGKSLSDEDVAALGNRTEGWIAGLQLAAISLRDRTDVSGYIAAFAGSNRFVMDYLIEEVLDQAPDNVREFLCQTAILDRFTGPLCDAVTASDGGAGMLATLERSNLFLIPLDDERRWYRYHHLFADVLRVRLLAHDTNRANILHRRASDWFERIGSPEEAIRHAFAASDFARAARVIESTIPGVRISRHDTTLLGWLAQLPASAVEHRPVLLVFSAWASLVAGDVDAVEPQLAAAEHQLEAPAGNGGPAHDSEPGSELDSLPVTIALYRAATALASGDLPTLAKHATQALESAAAQDHLGRGAAAGMLGLAEWAGGDLEAGVRAFRNSAASLRLAGNLLDALSTTMVVGDMLITLGRLGECHAAYEHALSNTTDHGIEIPPAADLHSGLSAVLRLRNQLEPAVQHLRAAEALGITAFSHEHRYRWSVAMADIARIEGDLDTSLHHLSAASKEYRRGFFPDARPIDGMVARVWILQGRLREARGWVEDSGYTTSGELSYLKEFGHITLARALLAEGTPSALAEAAVLLGRLLEDAQSGKRVHSVIEISILQALALQGQHQPALAVEPFGRALHRAEPEGNLRLFLDEGVPILTLLRRAAGEGDQPGFVRLLSQALRRARETDATATMAEPLSDRELHVLRLLATELTGPEISRQLHVSLNTMRTHTRHIFLKLDVNDRGGAVRRAETLGLI